MTLEEAEDIVRRVADRIDPNAQIIWGALIDESLDRNVIKTLVFLSGVRIPGYEEELEERVDRSTTEDQLEIGLKSI